MQSCLGSADWAAFLKEASPLETRRSNLATLSGTWPSKAHHRHWLQRTTGRRASSLQGSAQQPYPAHICRPKIPAFMAQLAVDLGLREKSLPERLSDPYNLAGRAFSQVSAAKECRATAVQCKQYSSFFPVTPCAEQAVCIPSAAEFLTGVYCSDVAAAPAAAPRSDTPAAVAVPPGSSCSSANPSGGAAQLASPHAWAREPG